jgi:hypothetical protein
MAGVDVVIVVMPWQVVASRDHDGYGRLLELFGLLQRGTIFALVTSVLAQTLDDIVVRSVPHILALAPFSFPNEFFDYE